MLLNCNLLSISVLVLSATTSTNGDCNLAQTYFIRHTGTGLTIDGTNTSSVTVENFTGFEAQQWRFTCGSQPGYYYIHNVASGYVLDIRRYYPYYIQTNPIDGTLEQQWIIAASGRIVNARLPMYTLDIYLGVFVPGTVLQIYDDNDTIAQEFMLQEKV